MMYSSVISKLSPIAYRSETSEEKLKRLECQRRKSQPRNSLCDCGSGKKFKHCCGGTVDDKSSRV